MVAGIAAAAPVTYLMYSQPSDLTPQKFGTTSPLVGDHVGLWASVRVRACGRAAAQLGEQAVPLDVARHRDARGVRERLGPVDVDRDLDGVAGWCGAGGEPQERLVAGVPLMKSADVLGARPPGSRRRAVEW